VEDHSLIGDVEAEEAVLTAEDYLKIVSADVTKRMP